MADKKTGHIHRETMWQYIAPPHKIQTRILRVLILSGRVGFEPTKKLVEPQAKPRLIKKSPTIAYGGQASFLTNGLRVSHIQ